MIKGVGIFVLMIFLFSGISASCNETQIDINTANLTELQKITQIGLSRAQAIIDSRPFSSVDDLARISGIGNGTRLNQIKQQGLACVSKETQTKENLSETNETIEDEEEESIPKNNSGYTPKKTTEAITLTPIALNIKSDEDKEILKKNLALGGVITFCIGFGALFLLKFARRRKENEFG